MRTGLRVLVGLSLLAPLPAAAARRFAVVVGVSKVDALPLELQTARARQDAVSLASYLEEVAGYSVQLILDDGVTRDSLVALLTETVPRQAAPGDTVLFAFIGNGVGADYGEPRLLVPDSRLDDLEGSTVDVIALGPSLSRAYDGVDLLIVTDAAHQGAAEGVALLGPSAKSWPAMSGSIFLLSAAAPNEAAPDGMFIPLLVAGLEGAADSNSDQQVTVSELHRHLLVRVAQATQDSVHPAEAGNYDPNLVIGLTRGSVLPPPVQAPPASARGERGFGGPVSYGLMGAGALAGGIGVVGYAKGRVLCAETGSWPDSCPATRGYTLWRSVNRGGLLLGGALVATGLGLGLVPLDAGPRLGVQVVPGGGLLSVEGGF